MRVTFLATYGSEAWRHKGRGPGHRDLVPPLGPAGAGLRGARESSSDGGPATYQSQGTTRPPTAGLSVDR
jgi:hypothetical protein